MSKTKLQLIEEGKTFGINNGTEMSYKQLSDNIRALKGQASPEAIKAKADALIKRREAKRKAAKRRRPVVSKRTIKKAKNLVAPMDVAQRQGRVELRKGILRYYYVIKGGNGEITSVSQKYFSKYNAERAAFAQARAYDLQYGQNIR